jgi:hypothetical protein
VVAAISGGDVQTIAIVVGSAVAAAVAAAAYRRNRRDETRSRWRDHDQIHGWTDDRGHWHPGAVDYVMGWQDESGRHEGLPERVDALEESHRDHARDSGAHDDRFRR